MENKLIRKEYLLPLIILLLGSCSKDFDFSGLFQSQSDADKRFTQSTQEGWQRFPAEINIETTGYTVLIAGDCHVGGTDNLVKLLSQAKKPGVTALFLAGDVSTGKEEDYKVLQQA